MMDEQTRDRLVLRIAEVQPVSRGEGVRTYPLVGRWNADGNGVTSGISEFAPGVGIPLHTHNVDETVLLLAGEARFDVGGSVEGSVEGSTDVGGESHDLVAGDATWIAAGVPHRFVNRGSVTMRFHWVYGGRDVTRTICATGRTVAHLSAEDRLISDEDRFTA